MNQQFFKMDRNNGNNSGGGGGNSGTGGGNNSGDSNSNSGGSGSSGNNSGGGSNGNGNNGSDQAKIISDLQASNKTLLERLEKLEKGGSGSSGGGGSGGNDPSLADKANRERQQNEENASKQRKLESAIKFSMGSKEWVKNNSTLLPKSIEGIFSQAEKENYADAIEKDSAIKASIVSEFFSVQENLDLLTPALKNKFDEFQKLTKNGKQDKAQQIYDEVFEPAFEMLKRIKKAEQLQKGHAIPTDAEAAYKQKLVSGARKHYLGDKQNGT